MKIVTTIRRIVGGSVFEPGQECEVDDRVAAVEIQGGRAKAPEKAAPAPAGTAAPARATTAATPAPKAEAAQPKATTEVKPMTLGQGPNPPPGAT